MNEEHFYAVPSYAEEGEREACFDYTEEHGDLPQPLLKVGPQKVYIPFAQEVMGGTDGGFPDGEKGRKKGRAFFDGNVFQFHISTIL